MEVVALVVLSALVGAGAVAFLLRRRGVSQPAEPASSAPSIRDTAIGGMQVIPGASRNHPTSKGPLSLEEIRALSDAGSSNSDGTSKIDRDAIKRMVEGHNAQAERAFFVVIAGEGLGRFIRLERAEYVIGRDPQDTDICFLDDAISKRHARVRLRDGRVTIEDLGSSNGTFVDGEEVSDAVLLKDGSRIVLGRSTVLALTFQDELGEQFQQRMYESSTRDQLTGAYNKATFLDHLASEMRFSKRHGTNFLLVIMDIDRFKSINDTYGHLVGDEILSGVARVIQRVVREDAHFSRYGGEEFIVAERNATAAEGVILAERIRRAVEESEFSTSSGPLRVTLSLGIADVEMLGEPDGKALIATADAALYEAKHQGRNRAVVATTEHAG